MGHILLTTKDDLYNKGFHYNQLMSDDVTDCYSLRFPVHKYKKSTVLECELIVELQTGRVITNVFNYGTNDMYVPYYNKECGNYEMVYNIQKTIETQLKKLGVKNK